MKKKTKNDMKRKTKFYYYENGKKRTNENGSTQ